MSGFIGTQTVSVSASGLFENASAGKDKSVQITYELQNGNQGGKASNYSLSGETLKADIEGDNKETAKILEMAETSVEEVKSDVTKIMLRLEETIVEAMVEEVFVENDFVASMGQWHMLTCQKESLIGNICSSN